MNEYIDGDYKVIEYENGTIIRELIGQQVENIEVNPEPTLNDKVNYLYYKSIGVIV